MPCFQKKKFEMKKNNFLILIFFIGFDYYSFNFWASWTFGTELLGNPEIQDDGFKMAAIFQSRRTITAPSLLVADLKGKAFG